MKYDGDGVAPAEIAQKARDLQMKLYEVNKRPREGLLGPCYTVPGLQGVDPNDFNRLVNIVTALAEATQWIMQELPYPERQVHH